MAERGGEGIEGWVTWVSDGPDGGYRRDFDVDPAALAEETAWLLGLDLEGFIHGRPPEVQDRARHLREQREQREQSQQEQ